VFYLYDVVVKRLFKVLGFLHYICCFCRAMLYKRGLCRHTVSVGASVCVCVCVSVTFAKSVKTNKHIFKLFSPSGSQAILVFPYQTACKYSDGNPLIGALNAGEVGRNRDSEPITSSTACCQCFDRPGVINTALPDHGSVSCDTYRWQ